MESRMIQTLRLLPLDSKITIISRIRNWNNNLSGDTLKTVYEGLVKDISYEFIRTYIYHDPLIIKATGVNEYTMEFRGYSDDDVSGTVAHSEEEFKELVKAHIGK